MKKQLAVINMIFISKDLYDNRIENVTHYYTFENQETLSERVEQIKVREEGKRPGKKLISGSVSFLPESIMLNIIEHNYKQDEGLQEVFKEVEEIIKREG